MALAHSPRIVTDGLVLCLDAGNLKSYDKYENLLQQSQALATSPWGIYSGGGFSVSNNVTSSPDGTFTASQINANPFTSGDSVYQDVSVSGTGTYTLSVFVKGGTCDSITLAAFYTGNSTQGFSFGFNPLTGTITGGSGTVVPYPNGWYRIYFTVTGTNASNNTLRFQIYTDTTGITYLWGAQLEKGSSLTDYYPTTTTAKNRGTTWTDLSGQGNNANISNYGDTPTFSSSFGGTFDFSGNKRFYVDVPQLNNTNSYSVIWFGCDGAGDQYSGVSRDVTWQSGNHLIGWQTGAINTDSGRDTNTNSTGDEFMICHTNDTSSKTVNQYLNGIYYGQFSYTSWASRERWTVGTRGDGNGHQYLGKIASIFLYNRILTASEVQQNFNALRGRFGI